MEKNKNTLICVLSASIVFLLSIYLLSVYHDGDLYFYRKFYDLLGGLPYSEVFYAQSFNTGSGEPIYGTLMWLAAQTGIDHDYFVATLNTILAYLIIKFLISNNSNYIFILLCFTNYYFFVLLTGAERLKVGFILMMIALSVKNSSLKYAVSLLTPLAHTQMIAHISAIAAQFLSGLRISLKINKKTIFLISMILIMSPLLSYVIFSTFIDIAIAKFKFYSSSGVNFSSILKIFIISLVGVLSLKDRKGFLWAMVVIALFSFFTGSDRFQISGLAILVYNLVRQKCTRNIFAITLMAVFSFKSIDFLYNTYVFGHGFADVRESTIN